MGTQTCPRSRRIWLYRIILIKCALIEEFFKQPPQCFNIAVIVSNIRVVHIYPVSHFPGKILPEVGVFHYILPACFVKILNGYIFWRFLISYIIFSNSKTFFNLKFNRKSMSIPSCLTFDLKSALSFETADCIFDRTGHNMMNSRDAVCRRRTFIKYKLTFTVQLTDASVESIILIPCFENLFV